MNPRLRGLLICLVAALAGFEIGTMASRSWHVRDLLGRKFGRGPLLALVNGRGIYDSDVERAAREKLFRAGAALGVNAEERRQLLDELKVNATIVARASGEIVPPPVVERGLELLRDEVTTRNWSKALGENRLTEAVLEERLRELHAAESWLGKHLRADVSEEESREYYEAHRAEFALPRRFRAAHIFVAAPNGIDPEVVAQKERAIEIAFDRLAHGEKFEDLARLCSEDEATKRKGGDLSIFSAARLPEDFTAAVMTVPVGEVRIVRTALGFHLLKVVSSLPPKQLNYPEVRAEIQLRLANERRLAGLERVRSGLVAAGGQTTP